MINLPKSEVYEHLPTISTDLFVYHTELKLFTTGISRLLPFKELDRIFKLIAVVGHNPFVKHPSFHLLSQKTENKMLMLYSRTCMDSNVFSKIFEFVPKETPDLFKLTIVDDR